MCLHSSRFDRLEMVALGDGVLSNQFLKANGTMTLSPQFEKSFSFPVSAHYDDGLEDALRLSAKEVETLKGKKA